MRGKHGNAAAGRRDRAELEERATTAERRADKAEKAHAELKATTDRQIAGLRADLAAARKERDEGAAPAVAVAEQQIRTLMSERDAAEEARHMILRRWRMVFTNLADALRRTGMTTAEASEIIILCADPDDYAATVQTSKYSKEVADEAAIGRARGLRSPADPLAAVRGPQATTVTAAGPVTNKGVGVR